MAYIWVDKWIQGTAPDQINQSLKVRLGLGTTALSYVDRSYPNPGELTIFPILEGTFME
jgi:hypothetical protein